MEDHTEDDAPDMDAVPDPVGAVAEEIRDAITEATSELTTMYLNDDQWRHVAETAILETLLQVDPLLDGVTSRFLATQLGLPWPNPSDDSSDDGES